MTDDEIDVPRVIFSGIMPSSVPACLVTLHLDGVLPGLSMLACLSPLLSTVGGLILMYSYMAIAAACRSEDVHWIPFYLVLSLVVIGASPIAVLLVFAGSVDTSTFGEMLQVPSVVLPVLIFVNLGCYAMSVLAIMCNTGSS